MSTDKVVSTQEVAKDILKLLNLEGRRVKAVSFHFEVDEAVEIQVKLLATQQQAQEVIEIIKQYELHEKPEKV